MNGLKIQDIKTYIAILITMGITRIKGNENYWSDSPSVGKTVIPDLMSKNCFYMMSAALHLVYEKESDICSRIDAFSDKLTKNFRKFYIPKQELAINECMISFTGKCRLKYYVSKKPIK